jgi:putative hydrolase of the HAD superfamily
MYRWERVMAKKPGKEQRKKKRGGTSDAAHAMSEAFNAWHVRPEDLNCLYDLTRASLDEVTHLTGYEDAKASRILTAVAFLSALAGGVYGGSVSGDLLLGKPQFLVHAFHAGFFLFALAVIVGAACVVHAIRPRFNVPGSWTDGDGVRSRLFAPIITKSSPADWASSFIDQTVGDVRSEYIKDHIRECYLVAEKLNRKLRPLQWGMRLFQLATILLLPIWLLLTAGIVLMPTASESQDESGVLVVLDADNTLWDTNALYADAQLELLESVESLVGASIDSGRLEFVRRIDQQIAADHPSGLRYPARLLVLGLYEALRGESGALPPQDVFSQADDLARQYEATIRQLPGLRPGVRRGLEDLSRLRAHVVVATEGGETSALKRLNAHGLISCVEHVIGIAKSPDSFATLRRQDGESTIGFSVGDQPDRDILFAKQAGFRTVLYPGGFEPRWLGDVDRSAVDYTISSLEELVEIVRRALESQERGSQER